MLKGMHTGIREATAADWPAIWPFFHQIVAAGDTFTFPTDLDAEEGRGWWLLEPPSRTVVAVDEAGTVVGTAKMNRNQAGNGSHVASASYMVDPAHGGRGIGRALVEYSLRWAKEAGFRGCSSTRSPRPTPTRCGSTRTWASGSSAPSRTPSATRRGATPDCT